MAVVSARGFGQRASARFSRAREATQPGGGEIPSAAPETARFGPIGWALAVAVLASEWESFCVFRLWGSEADEEADYELLSRNVDTFEECPWRGTRPSYMAPWARWNRLYLVSQTRQRDSTIEVGRPRWDLLELQHRRAHRGGVNVAHDVERPLEGFVLSLGAPPSRRVLRSTGSREHRHRGRAWCERAGRLAWKSEA